MFVELECSLCPRRGRYRLAKLAERYGAAVPLARLLEMIAVDCRLMKPGEKPRQYEARCGVRYVVPPGGPLPADAPARAGAPKLDPPGRKRQAYDGPRATIGQTFAAGLTRVRVSCLGMYKGHTCHHGGVVELEALRLPDEVAFVEIPRARRLRCSRCGARDIHVMPDWPDPIDVQRARMRGETGGTTGVDSPAR